MKTKPYQVTDNIHGTIYLSAMESEFISTPYFYRLHDIYQSSTVYMTFPSNRTKRYEHSLGTMELASSMFFSAISNAENGTRDNLFNELKKMFIDILDKLLNEADVNDVPYLTKCKEEVNFVTQRIALIDKEHIDETISKKYLLEGIKCDCMVDSALDYYKFYPIHVSKEEEKEEKEYQSYNIFNQFLYQCTLQALRLVALFHDVGHPPYSHIIEEVLEELYKNCTDNSNISEIWNKEKKEIKQIKQILEPYMNNEKEVAYKCHMLCTQSLSTMEEQLHEKIGFSLLQSAIDSLIPQLIERVSSLKEADKVTCIIYYIVVVEFAMAIRAEINETFHSIHKIVDGIVDSDRLDYVMRDSLNSGVDWGKIPYKRIIKSAKLICIDESKKQFVIAYSHKVTDDIIDLLLVRFKIFARINLHHSCVKTATVLQLVVYELAKDYCQRDNCINSDVSTLWQALALEEGNRFLRMIQWNDSWLISMLHKSLVNLSADEESNGTCEYKKYLLENLEETLLNKKRFYSLLKRGDDCKRLVSKAFDKAQITDEKLNLLEYIENKKYYSYFDKETMSTLILLGSQRDNSIKQIQRLREIKKTGDFELLDFFLSPKNCGEIRKTFEKVFNDLKIQQKVADYKIVVNKARGNTSLPSHKTPLDEIYIYSGKEHYRFNENLTLRNQIESIEKNIPWIFIYFVPIDTRTNIEELTITIENQLASELGDVIGKRYVELFESGK